MVTDFLRQELGLDWRKCTGISFVDEGSPLRLAHLCPLDDIPESAAHLPPFWLGRRLTCKADSCGADIERAMNSRSTDQAAAARLPSGLRNLFSVFRGALSKAFKWRATASPLVPGATRCIIASMPDAAVVSGTCACGCSAHAW